MRQALVAAGGKGMRLGELARRYGCKSLVPILGTPVIFYTIRWLQDAGIDEIIITVNYVIQYKTMCNLFRDNPAIRVMYNKFRTSSAQCIFPLRAMFDERFLFVYGHAPVPPEHVDKLKKIVASETVVTLYPTTSQGEESKKAAHFDGTYARLGAGGHFYVEPPHILDHRIVGLLGKTESWKRAFTAYPEPLGGVLAEHPSEFHYPEDLERVRKFLEMKINQIGI